MPTIVLNKMEDFVKKCKEFGMFNAYISVESYKSKEGEQDKITTIVRLTALTPAFGSSLLITNITQMNDPTVENKDPVMAFITNLQEKADKIVFSYGVAMM